MSQNHGQELLRTTLLCANELKTSFNVKGFRQDQMSGPQLFLLLSLEKSEQFSRAILSLCEQGFQDEATLIIRTFFEFYISLKLIDSDKALLNRYADFIYIVRKRKVEILRRRGLLDSSEFSKHDTVAHVEQEFERVKREHGFQGSELHWFPYEKYDKAPSFKKACIKVGALEWYDIIYQYWSDFAHANILSLMNYDFVSSPGQFQIKKNHTTTEGYEVIAAEFLLYACELFHQQFDLGQQERLTHMGEQLHQQKKTIVWQL